MSPLMRIALSWLLFFVCASSAWAQPTGTKPAIGAERSRGQVLQQELDRFHGVAGFPGGALAARGADGEVIVVTCGVRDRRTDAAIEPDDRFLAGSIGKTFFAAMALKHVEDDALGLDDPIADWLGDKEWFARLPNGDDVTVRMLLNHTSGLPDHLGNQEFLQAYRDHPLKEWASEELIAFALDMPARHPAGEGWAYADFNYIMLGAVLEEVSHAPVEVQVRERFLEPLKLDGIVAQSIEVPRIVTGHCQTGRVLGFPEYVIEDGRFVMNPQMEWCGGGYATTAGDLCEWTDRLFAGQLHDTSMVEQLREGVAARTGRDQQYGLGVQIRDSDHGRVYYHGGWFPGYMSETAYYSERDLALTVQVNSDHHTSPARFQQFLDGVVEALVKRESDPDR